MPTAPEPAPLAPVVPDFAGPCLANLVPALLADDGDEPPAWLPNPATHARQVVLLVLDGLGWEQLGTRAALAPALASGTGGPITSVAPSTTAAALTSLATGLPPAVHGMVGYRVRVRGEVLNVLRWQLAGADARRSVPPSTFQPHPAFPRRGGAPVPVVTRVDYGATGFTAAHLGDSTLRGWHTSAELVPEVRSLLAAGEPFVYAYYDGIDRVAHARGLDGHYDAELRAADRIVADLLGALPPGAALVVTADHGQVEVGPSVEVLGPDVMDGVELLTGEGRFRWLHARRGAADDVAAAATARFRDVAWVMTLAEVVDEGWLGGEPVPEVADRLGDVALVPFTATSFLDPADTGEQRLVGRHGSLTSAEMLVPLLSWPPGE
ncbi:MAG: alkaline phosphatase family protein [Acidimicrobiales bacterium]